jgi:hypothetical protein
MDKSNLNGPQENEVSIVRQYIIARLRRGVAGSVKLAGNNQSRLLWGKSGTRKLIELFDQVFVLAWISVFLIIGFSGHTVFTMLNFYVVLLTMPCFLIAFFLCSEIVRVIVILSFPKQRIDEVFLGAYKYGEIPETVLMEMRCALANMYSISERRMSMRFCTKAIPILNLISSPLAEEYLEELMQCVEDSGIRKKLANCTPQMLADCASVNELFAKLSKIIR